MPNLLLHFIVIKPIVMLTSKADKISTVHLNAYEIQVKGKNNISSLGRSFECIAIWYQQHRGWMRLTREAMTRLAAPPKHLGKCTTLGRVLHAPLLCTLITLGGCSEYAQFTRLTEGLTVHTIAGSYFLHKVIFTPEIFDADSLHVYIEGDGKPWLGGTKIAANPTPNRPYALELMRHDSQPALYLGRPCYFNTVDPNCDSRYWTDARYSKQVIDSMYSALTTLVKLGGYRNITLIGYSGGGVIATLLSERFERSVTLITLSANLNTKLWTDLHGYLPLTGSLNPQTSYSNPAHVEHYHFAGTRDSVVPIAVTQSFTEKYQLPLTTISDYDHACCWHRDWPALLNRSLRNADTEHSPAPP